jgi:hypothetical protein
MDELMTFGKQSFCEPGAYKSASSGQYDFCHRNNIFIATTSDQLEMIGLHD